MDFYELQDRLKRSQSEATARTAARDAAPKVQTSGRRKYCRKGEPIRYGITVEEFLQSKQDAAASYGEMTEIATARPGANYGGGW